MGKFIGQVAVGLDAERRCLDVKNRFGKAPGNQSRPHAGGEHHGDPTGSGILWGLSLGTQ